MALNLDAVYTSNLNETTRVKARSLLAFEEIYHLISARNEHWDRSENGMEFRGFICGSLDAAIKMFKETNIIRQHLPSLTRKRNSKKLGQKGSSVFLPDKSCTARTERNENGFWNCLSTSDNVTNQVHERNRAPYYWLHYQFTKKDLNCRSYSHSTTIRCLSIIKYIHIYKP